MESVLYWFIGVSSACVMGGILLASVALAIVGALSALVGMALYKGWEFVEAFLVKRSGVVQVFAGYELSGDRKVATVSHGNGFTATAAAILDTSKVRELDRGKLEEIIGRAERPFKLVMIVRPLDVSKVLDRLRTMQYREEIELSKLYRAGADDIKIRRGKARLNAIEDDIANITSGKAPLRILYCVLHAESSSGKFVAQEGAVSGLLSLCMAFDAALGTRSKLLSGGELLDVLRLDSMVE